MTQNQSVSLAFCDGKSDKVYHAQLKAADTGFVVTFQYGRRGAALVSGTKTATPLPYEKAKKTFDKVVAEKIGKGYSHGDEGVPYQDTPKEARKTDFDAQLLNVIDDDEAQRLNADPAWAAQEKKDGDRRAADADGEGNVTGMNRKGLSVSLPKAVADELLDVAQSGAVRIDAEIVGDKLYAFDLHVLMGGSLRQSHGWLKRQRLLEHTFANSKVIIPIPVAVTTEEKRALYARVKREGGEGVVYKRIDCLVEGGRPASGGDWLKRVFYARSSFIVTGCKEGKRSVSIGLLAAPGDTEIIPLGNVTVPANASIPAPNAVLDCEYLYAYKGGSLHIPIFKGVRTDIDVSECLMAQLKFKPEGKEDDEE